MQGERNENEIYGERKKCGRKGNEYNRKDKKRGNEYKEKAKRLRM